MKIIDLIGKDKCSISFEVFPPKQDSNFDSVAKAVEEIARLKPSFMSVKNSIAYFIVRCKRISC